jgi:hypothetical protein
MIDYGSFLFGMSFAFILIAIFYILKVLYHYGVVVK